MQNFLQQDNSWLHRLWILLPFLLSLLEYAYYMQLDNFECTWIYLTNSGPLSMDFLTVPMCTWVHTLGVPDHT